MSAPSRVLYELHNSLEPIGFENLCVDLLVREGFWRIVPGGKVRDHGRDAEVRFWLGEEPGAPRIAFQFSLEARWEAKLRRDISKITQFSRTVEEVVFVSSRSISVEKQDKLRAEFLHSHGIRLQIFDESWFRARLEEEHADLARKHLRVEVNATPGYYATMVSLHDLTDENCMELLRHTTPEALRATFRSRTLADPTSVAAWRGLASVAAYQRQYDAALPAIAKALELSNDETERLNLTIRRALILAEKGIQSKSRVCLKEAHAILAPIASNVKRAVDHYNLGNILGALDKDREAEEHYRRCLTLKPEYAPAWHNLGTLIVRQKGRREEGLNCLDRAISLKPDLVPALCTKANILVMTGPSCEEALALMDRAFSIDPNLEERWRHARYWRSMALCREGRFVEAHSEVRQGLERDPDCPFLEKLATDIFSHLWRIDPGHLKDAEEFFSLRIDPENRNYGVLSWDA